MAAASPKSPLTGSERVRCVSRIPAQQLINDWRSQFGIDISTELKGVSEITSYECVETGLVFFWPPSLEGTTNLYAQLQHVQGKGYYRGDKWEHDFALRQLGYEDVVLEVGCGTGEFLERSGRFVAGATGIEISETAVAAARGRGLAAHQMSLQDWVAQYPEAASTCCAFQVLEHVACPKEFIQLCIRTVRAKGKIIFGTPNAAGYLQHTYDLLDLPPHHMSRWDIGAFRSLEGIFPVRLRRYGIEPVQDWNINLYAESVARSRLGRLLPRGLVLQVARRAARSRMRRFLAGHTICVVFEKI